MKIALLIVAALAVVVVARFWLLGRQSEHGSPPGLIDGRLAPCPDKPNCVLSEPGAGASHAVEPLVLADRPPAQAWQFLQEAIRAEGGRIDRQSDDYLAATFRSRLFGFVDDLQARLDRDAGVIHLRSASRVGYGDLGVNRRRIAALARRYASPPGR